jgi:hypothetical protein
MRCRRSLLVAGGCCCCCHRCCQPRFGDRMRGRDQTVRVLREVDPGQGPVRFRVLLGPLLSGPAPVPARGRLRRIGLRPSAPAGRRRPAPYPGKARLYRDHPDYRGEVEHAVLIGRLAAYDGWALSTSAAALPAVLALCPPGVRVAAWHRGERPTRSRWPLHAWEPVIYHGGPPAGQRAAPGRFAGVRRRAAGHAARPGNRR